MLSPHVGSYNPQAEPLRCTTFGLQLNANSQGSISYSSHAAFHATIYYAYPHNAKHNSERQRFTNVTASLDKAVLRHKNCNVVALKIATTIEITVSYYGGHVNLGMIFLHLGWNFRLGVILFVLVSFYTLVRSTESWCDFSSPWLIFRRSAILFDLVLFHILVRSTASCYDLFSSWCDFVWFGVISYLGANN